MQTQTLAPPAGVPASWGARSAAGGESADLGMLCGVTPGGEEVNLAPQGRGRGCLLGRQSRGWTMDVPAGRAGPERTQLSEEAVPGCWLCPISALHTALFGVEILLPCGF